MNYHTSRTKIVNELVEQIRKGEISRIDDQGLQFVKIHLQTRLKIYNGMAKPNSDYGNKQREEIVGNFERALKKIDQELKKRAGGQ